MTERETTPLAAAIRALADQYRDLAVAEELNHVAIKAEQYPDMPATGRMQRALWDAEEVLMQRLADIQAGVGEIRATVADLQARDAQQYAESAQDRAALHVRLDRIEAGLIGRDELIRQHHHHDARLTALEQRTQAPDDDD